MQQHPAAYNQPGSAAELEAAFANFNQASSFLTEVYRDLELQVSSLGTELQKARQERTRQYQEKERLATRLQNLLEVLPAGVVVLDGDGLVVEYNPAALDLLGDPLLGEPWRDIVERSFSPRWDDGHDITLADNRCVNISTQSLAAESGQLILLKEVTENRQLQQQLGRLRRLSAMGEMASSLAHQIRTPLSSALLYASNIQHARIDSVRRNRFLARLIGRLRHLESLVEDMLLFARGGNLNASIQVVDALLEEFRDSVEVQVEQTATQLVIETTAGNCAVKVNRHAFISILQNLLNNAIQASGPAPQVRISVDPCADDRVEIRFSDRGCGINEQVRHSIFEPFFTTRAQGSGLGLAVADSVIRSHGGRIELADSSPAGTTFRIVLPVAAATKKTLPIPRTGHNTEK